MSRWKTKLEMVEAVQWLGSPIDEPKWAKEAFASVSMAHGDWLVRGNDSRVCVAADKQFKEVYEPYTEAKPRFLTDAEISEIRGCTDRGLVVTDDVRKLLTHIEMLYEKLDESDNDDMFGSNGWRYWFGISED